MQFAANAAASLSPAATFPPGSSQRPASSGGRARCATSSNGPEISAPATTIWFDTARDGIWRPIRSGTTGGTTRAVVGGAGAGVPSSPPSAGTATSPVPAARQAAAVRSSCWRRYGPRGNGGASGGAAVNGVGFCWTKGCFELSDTQMTDAMSPPRTRRKSRPRQPRSGPSMHSSIMLDNSVGCLSVERRSRYVEEMAVLTDEQVDAALPDLNGWERTDGALRRVHQVSRVPRRHRRGAPRRREEPSRRTIIPTSTSAGGQ